MEYGIDSLYEILEKENVSVTDKIEALAAGTENEDVNDEEEQYDWIP